jgi:hypothetical protein
MNMWEKIKHAWTASLDDTLRESAPRSAVEEPDEGNSPRPSRTMGSESEQQVDPVRYSKEHEDRVPPGSPMMPP